MIAAGERLSSFIDGVWGGYSGFPIHIRQFINPLGRYSCGLNGTERSLFSSNSGLKREKSAKMGEKALHFVISVVFLIA